MTNASIFCSQTKADSYFNIFFSNRHVFIDLLSFTHVHTMRVKYESQLSSFVLENCPAAKTSLLTTSPDSEYVVNFVTQASIYTRRCVSLASIYKTWEIATKSDMFFDIKF